MAGKAEWDAQQVRDAIVASGGGCHQLGWLRDGPWMVQRVTVGADGQCGGCGCHLASVDIDLEETNKFADSVSGLALERETKANFSQFQVHIPCLSHMFVFLTNLSVVHFVRCSLLAVVFFV
jgi:proteinaceous RNase P